MSDIALTGRQLAFIGFYLATLDPKGSAIKAGYSAKTAEVQSCRLLKNVKVKEAIAKKQIKLAEKHEITLDELVRDLKRVRDFCLGSDLTKVSNTKEALKSLDLLGKTIGAYTDRQEINITQIKVVREDSETNLGL